jgi:cell wall-associated NlpC family hydrolase
MRGCFGWPATSMWVNVVAGFMGVFRRGGFFPSAIRVANGQGFARRARVRNRFDLSRVVMIMRRVPPILVVAAGVACACGSSASGQPADAERADRGRTLPPAVAAITPAAAVEIGRTDVAGRVAAVHVISRVGDTGAADASSKHALGRDEVTLFALVEVEAGGKRALYSDAGLVRWRGKDVRPRPLAEAPAMTLAWNKVEPATADMSNTASGSFRYETIPYQVTPMAGRGGTARADVHPTLTPDHGDGLGTMRYQVVARQGDRDVAGPGIDARRGRGSGGLSDDVHRVSVRADDSFLGWLGEMYGQPYIWASAGGTDRTHQSERLEGSDCADLMVYGARRAGLSIPYGWTGSLEQHARVLGKGALERDGVYRDARGTPVPFTRPGDLVLFPRHVGALVEDRGTPGVLDTADVMLHTLFDSPRQQRIADSGYADNPIKVLRWKGAR